MLPINVLDGINNVLSNYINYLVLGISCTISNIALVPGENIVALATDFIPGPEHPD